MRIAAAPSGPTRATDKGSLPRGRGERERERQVPVGFIRSSEMVWMEKDGNGKRAASYGAGRDGRREKAGVIGPTCRCLIHIERICGLVL